MSESSEAPGETGPRKPGPEIQRLGALVGR
jgi:hypothetical protein